MSVYLLSDVRTLALYAQGLSRPNQSDSSPDLSQINQTVEKVNYVQIDTLNLIQRAQYIVLWSRLGSYTPVDFDRLIYSPDEKKLFEGLQGVAAIIPLKDYRYQLPDSDKRRQDLRRWFGSWMEREGNRELTDIVLERIKKDGGLRASDFEYDGPRRGSW